MKKTVTPAILWLFFVLISTLNGDTQTTCTQTTVWATGNNDNGELGDSTYVNKKIFTQTNASTDWKLISVGQQHTLAIKNDGSLWAWGANIEGALGDGTAANKIGPVRIGTATDWKDLSLGYAHTLALKTDGSLWAWGFNQYGQLGDGTTTSMLTPIRVGTATDWKQISAHTYSSAALKNDGSLWTWGRNEAGQLGLGTGNFDDKNSPTRVGTATDWKQIDIGSDFAIALKNNGSLWSWGSNFYEQLGDGTGFNRQSPSQVSAATDWKAVSAGQNSGLAQKNDGSLWQWGGPPEIPTPTKVDNSTDWQQFSAGAVHFLALKTNGTLWTWGFNTGGQFGTGFDDSSPYPIQVGIGANWKQVDAGSYSTSFALKCSSTDAFVIDPTKCYRITSKVSGKMLQVKDSSQTNGAQIYQWEFIADNANQLWQFQKTTDGKYNIASRNSGKMMDIQDNTAAGYCVEGTIIQQFTADGTNSQKWRFVTQLDGTVKMINETCNKFLRVENNGTANGASVGIKNDFGAESFKWIIQESPCFAPSTGIDEFRCYRIVNKATNKVLEVKDNLQTDGTPIYQWVSATNRPQQLWKMQRFNDGKYSISSVVSGKVMDILDNTAAGFCVEGTITQLFPYDGTNSQRWGLEPQADGSYKILNTTCNKYLRVEGSNTADGTSVGIKNDFGTDAFKWFFQEASCATGAALSAASATFSFDARASEGRAKLQWITNTGYKNDYFEVERLNVNGSFDVLGRQNTEGGDDMKSYTFTDNDPLDGDNFYRINSISNSNTPPQYSEVKKVTFSKNDGIPIFPNPADDFINVDLRKYEGQTVALSFYNSVGFLIKKQTIEKASAAPQRVDMQGVGTGSYLLRVQSEGKREVTRLFNITK